MNCLLNYQLVEKVHDGRQSVVYRAVRLDDGRPVILKRLKDDLPDAAALARFQLEYKTLQQLALPGVVQVMAFEQFQNSPFLVFEDFGGRALGTAMRNQAFSLEQRLRLALEIAGILDQVHAAGFIHRDINPSNFVYNPATGQLKLADFGLALAAPMESVAFYHPDQIEGTLSYLAPEQTGRMNQAIDSRTDLYALGVTFYELFVGRLPFDAEDPLNLVHAHMALPPPVPHQVQPDLPPAISHIILKLLCKNKEGRYQTAGGVRSDLARCLESLTRNGKIPEFSLGADDYSSRLQIPQKLYGREAELRILLERFEQASRGKSELLLVAGYSGTGKSSLVHEVHKPITERHGYFLSGKFNQYQQLVPYSAWGQALSEFCQHLLAMEETRLASWRRDILQAVGANGQLLVELIPPLEYVIGKQPPVDAISPAEAENRFITLLRNFLQVICRPEHPLVLFIDDWQWADAASLQLLKRVLADRSLQCLLVICAYRENEVDEAHPFVLAMQDLRGQGVPITRLALHNLTPMDLSRLVADALRRPVAEVAELAELVYEKTQGNPFFLKAFLYTLWEEKLLTFNRARRLWEWDLRGIRQKGLTDNVVDLLLGKLRRFAPETQNVLALAACVGNRFDLQTLSIISQRSPAECVQALWPAIVEGLAVPLDDSYHLAGYADLAPRTVFRFQHDRVQQAADTLIPPDEKPALHLRMGRLLLADLDAAQRTDRIFEVVDHLNLGRALITDRAGQVELMRLNLEAARKAKSASAYWAALQYHHAAFAWMENLAFAEEFWRDHYELALALFKERSETEYLNGCFERSEQLIHQAVAWAKTPTEKAEILYILIVQYTLLAKYREAIQTGRQALATLGIVLPETDYEQARDAELRQVEAALGGRPIADLFNLPVMQEPEQRTIARLLITMGPPCYRAHQQLWAVIVPKVINLCLQYGNIPQVGYSHTAFGGLLGYVSNNYPTAIQFGELATRLMTETFRSPSDQSVFYLMMGSSLRHWSRHLKESSADYLEAYQIGLRSSNLQYAAYAFGHNMYCRFYQGVALPELMRETERSLTFSVSRRNQWAIDLLEGGQIIFGTLAGTAAKPFTHGALRETEFLQRCESHRNIQVTCIYHVLKALALYVQGDWQAALAVSRVADRWIYSVGTQGLLPWAEHTFAQALIIAAALPAIPATEQPELRARLGGHLRQLRIWADHCPENFEHKYLLVAAEQARLEDRPLVALDYYDQAIAAARKQGFIQWVAVANECAARFWLARGKQHLAQPYLRQAHYAYELWGAEPKQRALETQYSDFLQPDQPLPAKPSTTTASTQLSQELDLATVLATAQTLAETVQLEPLLKNLMRLVLTNAGAETGYLLLPRDGAWWIQAEGTVQDIRVLQSIRLDQEQLPLSIVLYTARTHQLLILQDPANLPAYLHDACLRRRQPKSVCCLPLLNRGRLIGLLYLENSLVGGVFTPEQVEILRLLSAHMATAITNAQLYENLEDANLFLQKEITERQRAEQELRKSEHRFRAIFNSTFQLIGLLSTSGQLLEVNLTALEFAGLSPAEVLQRPFWEAKWWSHSPELQKWLKGAIAEAAQGRFVRREVEHIGQDGAVRIVDFSLKPILDEQGKVVLLLPEGHDITERKHAEQALRKTLAELEHYSYSITHDMRAPLRSMRVFSQILIADHTHEVSPQAQDYLRRIDAAAHRMDRLIQDVLNYSRISQDKMRQEPVDLNELVRQIVDQYPAFKAANAQIELQGPLLPVLGNTAFLTQSVSNLLGNAVKFVADGVTPHVRVWTERRESQVRLWVADNGLGIAPKDQQRIFNIFERVHANKKYEGTGIGLSIVRKAVERMGGQVGVESEPGHGSRFWIQLPAA